MGHRRKGLRIFFSRLSAIRRRVMTNPVYAFRSSPLGEICFSTVVSPLLCRLPFLYSSRGGFGEVWIQPGFSDLLRPFTFPSLVERSVFYLVTPRGRSQSAYSNCPHVLSPPSLLFLTLIRLLLQLAGFRSLFPSCVEEFAYRESFPPDSFCSIKPALLFHPVGIGLHLFWCR